MQLTLDGHEPRIKLYRQRGYELGSSDQWWAAKCADCGAPLSKFDFSEAECREIATAYLAKHQCPAAPLPPQ